ncbi:MAG: hypothetical protein NVS2B17_07940 [Candidatus Velthaea sp.]
MRAVDVRSELTPLAEFERRLSLRDDAVIPLLVIRLPALERTAWREGLRKARTLERRASNALSSAASGVLRAGDMLAHEPGSDVFLAALTAPTRGGVAADPIDARSALARISAMMENLTRLDVDTGWTQYVPRTDRGGMVAVIARALTRGAQERERYAFFSALGHELRTPLSSIRGYLETLLDDDIEASTRTRFLTIAYNESLRLSRLVEGMFEISLLDLQTAASTQCSALLDLALDSACEACAAGAAARSIRLVCAAISPVSVRMDGDRLTLVLINLIQNAIKHGRRAGTVRIALAVADERTARITIDDDGPGIPPADRKRIFAMGERGTTSATGSGIGLALVRLLLERDGGGVDVSDSPLGGARFALTIPRATES